MSAAQENKVVDVDASRPTSHARTADKKPMGLADDEMMDNNFGNKRDDILDSSSTDASVAEKTPLGLIDKDPMNVELSCSKTQPDESMDVWFSQELGNLADLLLSTEEYHEYSSIKWSMKQEPDDDDIHYPYIINYDPSVEYDVPPGAIRTVSLKYKENLPDKTIESLEKTEETLSSFLINFI